MTEYSDNTIKLNEERKLRVLAKRAEEAKRKEAEVVEPPLPFNEWLKLALTEETK